MTFLNAFKISGNKIGAEMSLASRTVLFFMAGFFDYEI